MLLCLLYAGDISPVSARCSSIQFKLITSMAGEQKATLPICVYLSFSLIHLSAWQLELQKFYTASRMLLDNKILVSCQDFRVNNSPLTWCSVAK